MFCRKAILVIKILFSESVVQVAQSCPTLHDPVYGLYSPRNFPGQNMEWVSFPFSRGLPNPGIKTRSPALQVDSLPAETQGKPLCSENNDLNKDVLIIINIVLKDPIGAK